LPVQWDEARLGVTLDQMMDRLIQTREPRDR